MSPFGYCASICLVAMLICSGAVGSKESNADVGPTKIRFYTGNLSVDYFIHSEGGHAPNAFSLASPEYCERMKSVSVSAACDYVVWRMIEPEPGKWDWSMHDANQKILDEHGMQYNVFCWLHFPPKWFMESPDYVPYRCVEHDIPIQQTSIWAPGTLKVFERFYEQLAKHFGDRIDFIRLATPAEYGEIGYPNGMTDWIVKQEHYHPGFWCNDEYARADFRAKMTRRFENIDNLNASWGTDFGSFDELEYPEVTRDRAAYIAPLDMTPQQRRWILDFIHWYYDTQEQFTRKAIDIVRKHFPDKEIIISMGYGSQRTCFGNDDVGIAKMCRDTNVACQTPGNIPYFHMKSLATPCKFYGVPYFTEPPGGVDRNAQVNRIWADASCGTQTFFDYPQNLLGAKEVFAKYKDYLDGSRAVVDVAFLFPTTDHRLRDQDWPQRSLHVADAFRYYLDYDLVDERMIKDGSLNEYRILVICDGNVVQAETLAALESWVRKGGVVMVKDFGPVETIDGDRSFYDRMFPKNATGSEEEPISAETALRDAKRTAKGAVIRVSEDTNDSDFARIAADITHNLSQHFTGGQDVPLIDSVADGVRATLFPTRILYLNPTAETVEKRVSLKASDFPEVGRTGQPERLEYALMLEPHSIAHIHLR